MSPYICELKEQVRIIIPIKDVKLIDLTNKMGKTSEIIVEEVILILIILKEGKVDFILFMS